MQKIKAMIEGFGAEVFENFDLSLISSMRIGERAKFVVFPKNEKQLDDNLRRALLLRSVL